MSIKKINEIKTENVSAGIKTTKQVLISSEEAPNFAMRKFSIEPGGSMPLHFNEVEHEQFVLSGSAEITIGNQKFIVQKNDVVFIPANVKHDYKTLGDEPFEFLCIVPNKKDNITLV